eukprot:TRINITY_DN13110_c0_g2_i1.p2 TRINITY_DN13110_c0_g2~~TRINITY_DN13110_c0_g2_i1.p2  ORF type:complete len:146 (-),score=3.39 TRINITY_DN13110_c0_g2_i1:272-709(-)
MLYCMEIQSRAIHMHGNPKPFNTLMNGNTEPCNTLMHGNTEPCNILMHGFILSRITCDARFCKSVQDANEEKKNERMYQKNDTFFSYTIICLSIVVMASLKHNVVPNIGDVIAYMRKWGDGLGDEFFQSGSFMKMRRSRRRSICY